MTGRKGWRPEAGGLEGQEGLEEPEGLEGQEEWLPA
jgi:hypothetical protein